MRVYRYLISYPKNKEDLYLMCIMIDAFEYDSKLYIVHFILNLNTYKMSLFSEWIQMIQWMIQIT